MLRIAVLAVALTGCATQFHVPPHTGRTEGWNRWTEPPAKVEIYWHRVGYFALQSICKSGYSTQTFGQGGQGPAPSTFGGSAPVVMPVLGCAVVDPQRKWCVIYTGEYVTEELVGHEVVQHCFLGKRHQ